MPTSGPVHAREIIEISTYSHVIYQHLSDSLKSSQSDHHTKNLLASLEHVAKTPVPDVEPSIDIYDRGLMHTNTIPCTSLSFTLNSKTSRLKSKLKLEQLNRSA